MSVWFVLSCQVHRRITLRIVDISANRTLLPDDQTMLYGTFISHDEIDKIYKSLHSVFNILYMDVVHKKEQSHANCKAAGLIPGFPVPHIEMSRN